MEELLQEPLAFSSSDLVTATKRIPLVTNDGTLLNIEIFEPIHTNPSTSSTSTTSTTSLPILLFIPGICESMETKSVQNIVSVARNYNVIVAVVELEGHGLSSGKRSVCNDFDRLLKLVLEFAKHTITKLITTENDTSRGPLFFLSGSSLGGALALYASQEIAENKNDYPGTFKGVVSFSPAVGVDPQAVPPTFIVNCLKMMSCIAPSATISLTPLEDPSHYNCPEDTNRNYAGHWPLCISKMLLDLTSNKVPNDLNGGKLNLRNVPSVLIITGANDNVVPLSSVEACNEAIKSRNKKIISISKAGHDLLIEMSSATKAVQELFDFIKSDCNNLLGTSVHVIDSE